jgi:ABC-type transporter Mla subunit MlaD
MADKKKRGVRDLTVEILKGIRDEIRHTNRGLDNLRADVDKLRTDLTERLDQTNARLDQTNARLDQHEKVLVKLIGEVKTLNDRFDNFLTGAHGKEHDELRARIERIEQRLDRAG